MTTKSEKVNGVYELAQILRGYRWPMGDERELQETVARALKREKLKFVREEPLASPRDRIDFVVVNHGLVGVECKVDGSPSSVAAQVLRYAKFPDLAGLILLTTRHTHASFFGKQAELAGKPFYVVHSVAGNL